MGGNIQIRVKIHNCSLWALDRLSGGAGGAAPKYLLQYDSLKQNIHPPKFFGIINRVHYLNIYPHGFGHVMWFPVACKEISEPLDKGPDLGFSPPIF